MNPVVVLLARAPSAKGKTRLTGDLPVPRARALRAALLLDTLAAAADTRLPCVVAFTPEDGRDELAQLFGGRVALVPQRGDDLGARMRLAIEDALTGGTDAVVLIGSDLPLLPPERVTDALHMLESGADVVLGPALDGGFYLVAARALLPVGLFERIAWGTAEVFERVLANAHDAELTVGVLPVWWDVDGPEDLTRVLADPRPHVAARVRAWSNGA